MMICKKCEQELSAGTVFCRNCGHSNISERIDSWRARCNERLQSAQPQQPQVTPTIKRTRREGQVVPFPKQPQLPPPTNGNMQVEENIPEWRSKLRSRLQEIREQRAAEYEPQPVANADHENDRDPRVAAALNRIQRANYLQPIPPARTATRRQTALAHELQPQSEPMAPPSMLAEQPIPAVSNGFPQSIPAPPVPLVRTAPTFHTNALVAETAAPTRFVEAPLSLEVEPTEPLHETEEDLAATAVIEIANLVEDPEIETVGYLEPASLKLRLAAAVIDAEVIALSFLPLFAVFAFFGGTLDFASTAIYLLAVLAVMLMGVYFFLTYVIAGRTVGMGLLKLHLASRTTQVEQSPLDQYATITFTNPQAAARALGGVITLLCFPANLICITKSYDRLSISDYLSDLQVVRVRK